MPSHLRDGFLAVVLSCAALAPLQVAGAQEARPSAGYIQADDGVRLFYLVSPTTVRRAPFREQLARNRTAGMDDSTRRRLAALGEARSAARDPVAACRAYYALFFRGFYADPMRRSAARGNVCDDSPKAVRNQERAATLTLHSLGGWDWRAALAGVSARTLVMYGMGDPIPLESAREWVATSPGPASW